jgi:hypothetical protein
MRYARSDHQFNFGSDSLSKEGTSSNLTLRAYDVNEVNSYLLSHFIKNIEERLVQKKGSLNNRITRAEIDEVLMDALKTQMSYSTKKIGALKQTIEELQAKSAKDVNEIEDLQAEVNKRSLLTIKLLIVGLLIQFAGLYYITYHVAGWDLGEPISYLLAICIEIIGKIE